MGEKIQSLVGILPLPFHSISSFFLSAILFEMKKQSSKPLRIPHLAAIIVTVIHLTISLPHLELRLQVGYNPIEFMEDLVGKDGMVEIVDNITKFQLEFPETMCVAAPA